MWFCRLHFELFFIQYQCCTAASQKFLQILFTSICIFQDLVTSIVVKCECFSVETNLFCIFRGSFEEELKLHLIKRRNFCSVSSKCSNKLRIPFLVCLLFLEEIISSSLHNSKTRCCSRCSLLFWTTRYEIVLNYLFICLFQLCFIVGFLWKTYLWAPSHSYCFLKVVAWLLVIKHRENLELWKGSWYIWFICLLCFMLLKFS